MKSITHERHDPMVFWVESIGKLSTVIFLLLIIKIFSFFKHGFCNLFYYHVCSVIDGDYLIYDFSGNIWVASFVVYAFHGSTSLQSGVCKTTIHIYGIMGRY